MRSHSMDFLSGSSFLFARTWTIAAHREGFILWPQAAGVRCDSVLMRTRTPSLHSWWALGRHLGLFAPFLWLHEDKFMNRST